MPRLRLQQPGDPCAAVVVHPRHDRAAQPARDTPGTAEHAQQRRLHDVHRTLVFGSYLKLEMGPRPAGRNAVQPSNPDIAITSFGV